MLSGRIRSRWNLPVLAWCCVVFLAAAASGAVPKRVLVVHSFGNAAPPFTTHSTAFETELTAKMGEPVDLDEVSLDVARYATLDMEEALVDLMRKRQTRWQPDLVVPIGSPAGVFVARHRDRLFPATTPIIYAGMDQRRLPAGALEQNATFVGESFDVPGWVDDILQIAPDTKNIAVVIGASPLEQFWTEVLRKEFQPFEDRVNFTWLNDLSLEGIVERTKTLPPRSFIFLVLMMRDATGATHNADEALRRIHAAANAPINGIFVEQLGLGIVGGRLYQAEAEGVEAARIAIRILRGEPAANFPPMIIPALPPRYDSRELQRWKIDEKSLPPGSTVLFRAPTLWQQHRGWVIGVVSVCVAQAVLISALIANLVRRRRAEGEARRQREQIELLGRASLLGEMTASLAHELGQPLAAIMANASAGARFIDEGEAAPGDLREIFSDIGTDGRRARDIVQNVRNAIKHGSAMRGRVSVNKVVENVALMVRPDAAAGACEVQTSLAENLPLIEADPVQIQQILINLVSNAFHAMHETPLADRKVEITTHMNGDQSVRVTVRDHGAGISDETRDQLFEHFYTTKKDGLGMGLAVVRSIVQAHGGKITAGNAEGGGACFEFELPASANPRE